MSYRIADGHVLQMAGEFVSRRGGTAGSPVSFVKRMWMVVRVVSLSAPDIMVTNTCWTWE